MKKWHNKYGARIIAPNAFSYTKRNKAKVDGKFQKKSV
jgi:hypothetical protein